MYSVELPCKHGDDYWWIDSNTLEIRHEKGGIKGVVIHLNKPFEIIDADGERCNPGTQWCCITLEEAEAVRKEMLNK